MWDGERLECAGFCYCPDKGYSAAPFVLIIVIIPAVTHLQKFDVKTPVKNEKKVFLLRILSFFY